MSKKRKLTSEEERFASQNLEILKEEYGFLTGIDIPQKELTLQVAELSVKRQMKQVESELKKLKNDAEEIKKSIEILEDQIKNGVEIKKDAKSK